MAFKDLTEVRIRELRNQLNAFLVDLDDLIKHKSADKYSEKFSSVRAVENSREESLQYPSLFYSLKVFDSFVEIRRQGKSEFYSVLSHKFDFTPDFVLGVQHDFACDVSYDFNNCTFANLSFDIAVSCFRKVVSFLMSSDSQGVLIF